MKRLLPIFLTIGVLFVSGCSQRGNLVTLRVMSYNIHHGEGMDGQLDLERIASVIRSEQPDLVALQEVDRGTRRTEQIDQPARLAELTGMQAVFERNIDYQGGEYGNAVLSRLPVRRHENHHLPSLTPGEQRGLLEVQVEMKGGTVVFFATHFDYRSDERERLLSVAVARERVEGQPHPIIVAGDLNATPDSATISSAAEFLKDTCSLTSDSGFTFRADAPTKRIDYILHNGHPALRPVECRVLDEPVASDHRPVLAVFEVDSRRLIHD